MNMADIDGVKDDEATVEDAEIEQEEEQESEEQESESEEGEESGDDEGEVVVSIGDAPPASDEKPEERAPEWVRELRKASRDKDRKIKELEQKLTGQDAAEKATSPAARKPTLEDCDYDSDEFERRYDAWSAEQRKVDEERRQKEDAQKQANAEFEAKREGYNQAKTKLKVQDFDDAEGVVQDTLSETQQGIILHAADNPVLVVYALGKNSAKAKELSAIKDPIKFAFAVAKLETQVKTSTRKAPPAPEGKIRGNAPASGAVDSTLDRLRAEAEKTGDMSKVMAHKAALRAKGK